MLSKVKQRLSLFGLFALLLSAGRALERFHPAAVLTVAHGGGGGLGGRRGRATLGPRVDRRHGSRAGG